MPERTFHTHTDSTLDNRNGQPITVLRAIRHADNAHDLEVLPMFVIRFPDGEQTEAWRDEIRTTVRGWYHVNGYTPEQRVCRQPEPRPGGELLRASLCRNCGDPINLNREIES